MVVNVEIFSQGEEIVTGQVTDTNAAWLGQQLTQMGFLVSRHSAVGDKLNDLVILLQEISLRADFCICSGGLGPTVDDLTAEAVAQAFTLPLEFDALALQQIELYFLTRQRSMPDSNRKQALLPKGAERLDNDWGTAPGFALQAQRCWFAFVPGVPYEMRNMFQQRIITRLQQRFQVAAHKLVTLKTVGIGESDIQQSLQEIVFPENVQLSFRADPEEVQTKLLFLPDCTDTEINSLAQLAKQKIGDFVFNIEYPGQPSSGLVSVISESMLDRNLTLSVADYFSHGLIAAKCVGKNWLEEAYYSYSVAELSVASSVASEQTILASGINIAEANRLQNQTDFALVQLAEFTTAQLNDKNQAIKVYHILATKHITLTRVRHVTGPSLRKYNQAAILALDVLRRHLQGLSPN